MMAIACQKAGPFSAFKRSKLLRSLRHRWLRQASLSKRGAMNKTNRTDFLLEESNGNLGTINKCLKSSDHRFCFLFQLLEDAEKPLCPFLKSKRVSPLRGGVPCRRSLSLRGFAGSGSGNAGGNALQGDITLCYLILEHIVLTYDVLYTTI